MQSENPDYPMPTETPMKQWVYELMERFNVCEQTIYRWRRLGKIFGVKYRYFNRKVIFVSGEAQTGNLNYMRRYDFSAVDWSKTNRQISEQLGCDASLVRQRRKQWMETT